MSIWLVFQQRNSIRKWGEKNIFKGRRMTFSCKPARTQLTMPISLVRTFQIYQRNCPGRSILGQWGNRRIVGHATLYPQWQCYQQDFEFRAMMLSYHPNSHWIVITITKVVVVGTHFWLRNGLPNFNWLVNKITLIELRLNKITVNLIYWKNSIQLMGYF